MRRRLRESAVRAAILIIAAIEVWRLVLVGSGATPMRIYHGTDTRLDEIVLGCLLALLLEEPSRVSWLRTLLNRSPALPVICLLGLPAAGAMMPIESSAIAFLGYPLFGLLSAVVVAAARFDERGAFAAVLSRSAIGYVGRLSYGVYLWHIPVHELTRSGGFASGAARDVLSVCVTFLLAASTYHFVEGPIRRSAARGQRVSVGTPAGPTGRVDPLRPVTTSVAVV